MHSSNDLHEVIRRLKSDLDALKRRVSELEAQSVAKPEK